MLKSGRITHKSAILSSREAGAQRRCPRSLMEKPEYTITEAAGIKGIRRSSVHKAVQEGRLPARVDLRPGAAAGRWLIKAEDLAAWTPATPQERGRRSGIARRRKGTEK